MIAATAHKAPTEAEIREAIDRHAGGADFGQAIYDIVLAVRYHQPDEDGGADSDHNHVWTNLRPSEARRLSERIEEVMKLADRFEKEVIEATVQAALTFAAEHPDAPRAKAPG